MDLIAPDKDTVVVFGSGFTGRKQPKGDRQGPIAVPSIRAALASRRIVVLVDEYNTTARHLVCGSKLVEDPDDNHEKICLTCDMRVDRDGNASSNIRAVWTSDRTTGMRPEHLRRP